VITRKVTRAAGPRLQKRAHGSAAAKEDF
jgi:hypothetical protein